MKNIKAFKLAIAVGVSSIIGSAQASSFDDAIKSSTTSGQLRLAYISVAPDITGGKTTTAAAVAGQFKLETAKWNSMQFAIAPYFSEKLNALSGDKAEGKQNGDLFDSSSDSFAYLAEAYINYAFTDGALRLGRQQLDSPFINGDDIRLFPNTFNAAWLNMQVNDRLSLDAGVVSEWAGFDSGDSQDNFKTAGADGVTAVGGAYKMKEHHIFQAWYYHFEKQYNQYYFDALYQNGNFGAGLQYSDYQELNASKVEGQVYGINVNYVMGSLKFDISVNNGKNAAGKSASLGLGGGNYYASMDAMTIGGLTDAKAQVISVEYVASDKMTISIAAGQFEDKNKATTNTIENDIALSYSVNEKLDASLVYATVKNKAQSSDADTNFSRLFAQMNYTF